MCTPTLKGQFYGFQKLERFVVQTFSAASFFNSASVLPTAANLSAANLSSKARAPLSLQKSRRRTCWKNNFRVFYCLMKQLNRVKHSIVSEIGIFISILIIEIYALDCLDENNLITSYFIVTLAEDCNVLQSFLHDNQKNVQTKKSFLNAMYYCRIACKTNLNLLMKNISKCSFNIYDKVTSKQIKLFFQRRLFKIS